MTKHQQKIAADFISAATPAPAKQRAFDKAWRHALAIERLKKQQAPTTKRARKELVKELRLLGHKLVPAPKQAAVGTHVRIVQAALRQIKLGGGLENFNITDFAEQAQSNPSLQRIYKAGRGSPLTPKTIRLILNKAGIIGTRGRKPKK